MAEYLVIRLASTPDAPVSWVVADDAGTLRSHTGSGTLEEAAAAAAGRSCIVMVPATEVLTTTVDIPVRGGARLRAALPFALEEHVAEDVEGLHFASGTRRDNGQLPVAIVARDQLDAWIATLAEAGISASRIVPENYGLARIPGTASVLVDGDLVFFNDGGDTEFALQGGKPSDALVMGGLLSDKHQERDDDESTGHLLVYCEAADEERLSHEWIALRQELHSVDINLLPDGALPRLAVTVASGHGVNLLQGQYGERTDYRAQFMPWRSAAALLLGLFIAGFVAKGVDYYRLTNEQETLKAQFTTEYREIRPDDNREILDPIQRVRSIRQGMGSAAGPQVFLPSLRQLSDAMAQNSSARIETLSYRAGVIDIRNMSPDVATLDNIQKAVSASGDFQASIQSTDQVDGGISSRLQIREGGS